MEDLDLNRVAQQVAEQSGIESAPALAAEFTAHILAASEALSNQIYENAQWNQPSDLDGNSND